MAGIYVVAFERVVAGWARITATGPANTLITIHFGEKQNVSIDQQSTLINFDPHSRMTER